MVRSHHRLSGYEFEQTSGDGEGQGGLVCCSLWGHRVGHDRDDLAHTHTAIGEESLTLPFKKF